MSRVVATVGTLAEQSMSMDDFVKRCGVQMYVGQPAAVKGYKRTELRLVCSDREISIDWLGEAPVMGAVLDYLALIAQSIETTNSPAEWLEEYGDVLCPDAEAEDAEQTYRECISDTIRLRFLLGDENTDLLLCNVEPPLMFQ
jgi:hypothetical protein